MIKDNSADFCDHCKAPVVVNDLKGLIVCTGCGVIKEDRFVNQSSEYRYFNDDSSGKSDPRRVGNSVNIFMDSQIDLIEIADYGKSNYMTYAVQSQSDKAYTRAIKLIKRYCELLDLPQLQRPAEEYYFEVKDHKEIKGKRMETLIAAIIFLAGKRTRVYLQMQSLEPIADAPYKKILKACNVIVKLIPKIIERSYEYVKQFGQRLKLPRDVVVELEKICKEVETKDTFKMKQPKYRTIAAAVLYFYSILKPELNLSLNQIKEASGVASDNTIKKYFSSLMDNKDVILKNAFKEDKANPSGDPARSVTGK